MKKILSMAVATILTAGMAFTALPASAASGVDIVDTFESYYGKKDLIASTWKTDGCFTGNISTDTQDSAPNRGNGKDKGNYRSMKAAFNFGSDTWGSIRDMTEDNYALIDAVSGNHDVNFTFYAKADKPVTFTAEIDIKDCPFYGKVQLTTSWQKYTLSLRSLTPELNDKNGNATGIYDRNAQQAWGNGKEEAFLVGFKFQINQEDNTSVSDGTVWLDTLAFEGSTITERSEDNTQDKSGTVPSDYKSDTPSSSTTTGGNTNNATGTTGGTTSSGSTTGGKTTTSTNADGSTVTVDENGSVVTDSTEDDSTIDDDSSEDSTKDESKDSSKDSSKETVEKSSKGSMKTGTKVAIIITIIVVLAGGGAAVYFLIIKKKKETIIDDSQESEDENQDKN